MGRSSEPQSAWSIREESFPRHGDAAATLSFLLRYALLAPSSHNTQPWRFSLGDGRIGIHADRARWLQVADPGRRELYISLGCALENLLIAVEHFGYGHETEILPDGEGSDLAARVTLLPQGEPAPFRPPWLFGEITSRHTNHRRYEPRPIPADVRRGLEACCVEEGVRLFLTDDPEVKRRADEMVIRADAEQFSQEEFREELAYWIGQGVFGTPWLLSKLGALAVSYLDVGGRVARRDHDLLMGSPLLGVLTSERDDHESHLRVGQAFERLYLTATAQSIGLQPMSQAVQVPGIRAELRRLLPDGAGIPQQPFRLGYAVRERDHTPRRPLEEVLR